MNDSSTRSQRWIRIPGKISIRCSPINLVDHKINRTNCFVLKTLIAHMKLEIGEQFQQLEVLLLRITIKITWIRKDANKRNKVG